MSWETATEPTRQGSAQEREVSDLIDFVDNALVGLHWVGPDGRILWANRAELELLGYAAEEYIGRHVLDFHVDRQAGAELLRRLRANEAVQNWEARLRAKNGSIRTVLITSNALFRGDDFVHTRCFTRDVTERKRAEYGMQWLLSLATELSGATSPGHVIDVTLAEALRVGATGATLVRVGADARVVQVHSAGDVRPSSESWRSADLARELAGDAAKLPLFARSAEELAQQQPMLAGHLEGAHGVEFVALPLHGSEALLGILWLCFRGPSRDFDSGTRDLFLGIARQCAVALDRALLFESEQRAKERLATISEVTRVFAEPVIGARELAETICHEVATRLGHACALTLADFGASPLRVEAYDEARPEGKRTLERTLSTLALDGGPSMAKSVLRSDTSTAMQVPLMASGRVIGRVTAARDTGGPPYTNDDLALLQEIAYRAALAITRAQQHSAEEEARQRLAVLAQASATLAQSLDYESTLHAVIGLALPRLGDFGFFDVLEADGTVRRIARAHQDPRREAILAPTRWQKSQRTDLNLCALSSGYPAVHSDIDEAWLRNVAVNDGHYAVMDDLAFQSMLTVPLRVQDQVIGALTLFFVRGGRRHTESDVELGLELARRAAAAVQNASLFREAQEAIRKRDEFLSAASHELKTPLTTLELHTSALLRARDNGTLHTWPADRLSRTVEKFDVQLRRLNTLVHDLLDVSRISAGRLALEPTSFDLSEMVRDVLGRFADESRKGHTPIVDLGLRPLGGKWDKSRLDQVVTNLVSNALKYGRGKPIEVSVQRTEDRARLCVRDHGVGIPAEEQSRIFERFERASTARTIAGMGLGLWIVKQIIDAHGGTVSVQSEPGEGATFVCELPVGE